MGHTDISGLFGVAPDGPKVHRGSMSGANWNKHIQVFEAQAWDDMMAQLLKKQAEGRPLSARIKSNVLPNKHQGVQGGYTIDMFWIFLGGKGRWIEQVPEETRNWIEKNHEEFPYMSTFNLNYGPE